MKKLIYLFSITIALTVFTSVKAKADDGSYSDDHEGSTCGSTSTTQLPINGGVEFLMVAGVVIGIVTVQKYKTAKTATVQE